MNEFLVSSQKVPELIPQELLSRKAGKELPGNEEKWQWLYRFPNGLGANVIRTQPRSGGNEVSMAGWQNMVEVAIIQWNGDRWKLIPDSNRRVMETDLEPYLMMIKDVPPEEVSRFTKA
jgi:hypothetical protein